MITNVDKEMKALEKALEENRVVSLGQILPREDTDD